jgi:hypothetical protein
MEPFSIDRSGISRENFSGATRKISTGGGQVKKLPATLSRLSDPLEPCNINPNP